MALRIQELVTGGEIYNNTKNSVHGRINLRGVDRPIILDLTGNCAPDLAGRCFRFQVPGAPQDPPETGEDPDDALVLLGLPRIAWAQIGPTGTFTAARRVRVTDCPPIELLNRCKLDEPPPMDWTRAMYLEWFGQNGRVVVEIANPIIEFFEPPATLGSARADNAEEPEADPSTDPPAFGAAESPWADDVDDACDVLSDDPGIHLMELPESSSLIPDELQRQFDREARDLDRTLFGEPPEFVREMELMDELIERGGGEPLGTLFDGALQLPRPDQLDEDGAEQAMKVVLAKFALYGVAFDICPHFSMKQAYELLIEEICPEQTAFEELRGTQWVQHYSTHDHCPECEAEFDREYRELHP